MIEDEDRPMMALGTAFAASTLVFAIMYALGKTMLHDAFVSFMLAVIGSLLAMRVVYVRCAGDQMQS